MREIFQDIEKKISEKSHSFFIHRILGLPEIGELNPENRKARKIQHILNGLDEQGFSVISVGKDEELAIARLKYSIKNVYCIGPKAVMDTITTVWVDDHNDTYCRLTVNSHMMNHLINITHEGICTVAWQDDLTARFPTQNTHPVVFVDQEGHRMNEQSAYQPLYTILMLGATIANKDTRAFGAINVVKPV